MSKNIALVAQQQKKIYTSFIVVIIAFFILTSLYTGFNPMVLIENSDAFVSFVTEDFFPPALPKASRILGILSSVVVTLALAMSSTTIAAIAASPVAISACSVVPALVAYVLNLKASTSGITFVLSNSAPSLPNAM